MLRILARHPNVETFLLEHKSDTEDRAVPLGARVPNRLPATPEAIRNEKLDLVFLGTPADVSISLTPEILDAGAKVMGVPPSECHAANGRVIHKSGKSVSYAELVAAGKLLQSLHRLVFEQTLIGRGDAEQRRDPLIGDGPRQRGRIRLRHDMKRGAMHQRRDQQNMSHIGLPIRDW